MEYIVRIKAVSLCLGIRRSSIYYTKLADKYVDLVEYKHPISIFKRIKFDNNIAEVLDKKEELHVGSESYFYNIRKVKTLTGEEVEKATLGVMLIPVSENVINNFIGSISNELFFDQWDGEYEYLVGIMKEILNQDDYTRWYDIAKNKNFYDKLI